MNVRVQCEEEKARRRGMSANEIKRGETKEPQNLPNRYRCHREPTFHPVFSKWMEYGMVEIRFEG